jgi:4-amino-4-deoxy-L-arabinose transferase-like glycosyltransferase
MMKNQQPVKIHWFIKLNNIFALGLPILTIFLAFLIPQKSGIESTFVYIILYAFLAGCLIFSIYYRIMYKNLLKLSQEYEDLKKDE